ncbi:MAG: PmbA/TldA family metallopeptidase, partial [Candidatus Binataceae bacterium]
MSSVEPGIDLARWGVEQARAAGADAAEVLIVSSESLSAGVRMGEVEKLKSSRERRLGVRIFVGQSSATASTAEFERKALSEFVADTVRLARLTAPDQFSGLPDPKLHPRIVPELELSDPSSGIIEADRAL